MARSSIIRDPLTRFGLAVVSTMAIFAPVEPAATALVETLAGAEKPVVILVRNGDRPQLEAERRLIVEYSEADEENLIAAGYIALRPDPGVIVLVDPLAPPVREYYLTRILLTELGVGDPVRFGDMSAPARMAVRSALGGSLSRYDLAPDTLIGQVASIRVRASDGDTIHRAELPLTQGSGTSRSAYLNELGKAPMVPRPDVPGRGPFTEQTMSPRDTSEIEFGSGARSFPGGHLALYVICTKAVENLALLERTRASAAYRDVLLLLALTNPQVANSDPQAWDRSGVPQDAQLSLADSFSASWRAYGFSSPEEARQAWMLSSVSATGIAFDVVVAFDAGSATPQFFSRQIAWMRR